MNVSHNSGVFINNGFNSDVLISTGTVAGNVYLGNNVLSQIVSVNGATNNIGTLGGSIALGSSSSAAIALLASSVTINQNATGATTSIGEGSAGLLILGGNANTVQIKSGAGSGAISIGDNSNSTTISIGTGLATGNLLIGGSQNTVNINSGTGGSLSLNVNNGGASTLIGTSGTTGIVRIGGTSNIVGIKDYNGSGTINLATGDGTINVNISNGNTTGGLSLGGFTNTVTIKGGSTSGEVRIATGAGTTAVSIGTSGTTGGVTIGNTSNNVSITSNALVLTGGANLTRLIGGVGGVEITGPSISINNNVPGSSTSIGGGGLNTTIGGATIVVSGNTSINQGATFETDINASGSTGLVTIGARGINQTIRMKSNINMADGSLFGRIQIASDVTPNAPATVGITGDVFIAHNASGIAASIGTGSTTATVTIGGGGNLIVLNPSATGVDVSNKKIINLALPSTGNDAASKSYTDNSRTWKEYVECRTTDAEANLLLGTTDADDSTSTYSNNVLTSATGVSLATALGGPAEFDGYPISNGMRVLLVNTNQLLANNSRKQGIYVVTQISPIWILTRVTDMNESIYNGSISMRGVTIPVRFGTLHARTYVTVTGGGLGLGLTNPARYDIISPVASSGGSVTISNGSTVNGAITVFDTAANTIRAGATVPERTPTITAEGQIIMDGTNNQLTCITYGRNVLNNFANSVITTRNVIGFGINLAPSKTLDNIIMTLFGKNCLSAANATNTLNNTVFGYNCATTTTGAVSNSIIIGSNNINGTGSSNIANTICIGNDILPGSSTNLSENVIVNRLSFNPVSSGAATNNCVFGAVLIQTNANCLNNVILGNVSVANNGVATQFQDNCIIGTNTINKSTFTPQITRKTLVGYNNTLTYAASQNVTASSNLTILGNSNSFTYTSTIATELPDLIVGNNNTFIQNPDSNGASATKGNSIIIGNTNTVNFTAKTEQQRAILIGTNISTIGTSVNGVNNRNILIGTDILFDNIAGSSYSNNILLGSMSINSAGRINFDSNVVICPGTGTNRKSLSLGPGNLENTTIINPNTMSCSSIAGRNIVISSDMAVSLSNIFYGLTLLNSNLSSATNAPTFANVCILNANVSIGGNHNITDSVFIGGSYSINFSILNGFYSNLINQAVSGSTVVIDSNGRVGQQVSRRSMKYDIEPLAINDSVIDALEPKKYKFVHDNSDSIGLIVEDVHPLIPEICPLDKDGVPASIRYDLLSVVLLDEIKKQKATIANLLARVSALESN